MWFYGPLALFLVTYSLVAMLLVLVVAFVWMFLYSLNVFFGFLSFSVERKFFVLSRSLRSTFSSKGVKVSTPGGVGG